MDNISLHIEALIFASEEPLQLREIKQCLQVLFDKDFEKSILLNKITALQEKYKKSTAAFEIVEMAGGYRFLTKGIFHPTVVALLKQKSKKKLSKSALETLSVIAYKQPISKSEMERIRGVNCDYAVRKLLDKELIKINGRSKDVGRPLLYGTSDKFMQHFGLNSIKDLPKLKEFKHEENQIGKLPE
jgi:segregation and condensation protein B